MFRNLEPRVHANLPEPGANKKLHSQNREFLAADYVSTAFKIVLTSHEFYVHVRRLKSEDSSIPGLNIS